MKEYLQMQKYISVLMIFILSAHLSGCTGTKVIFPTDFQMPYSLKCIYIVHCEQEKYLLKKSTISNDTISGKIKHTYVDNSYDKGNKIHLYLSSDSVIKIDKGEFLSVPIGEVLKVEVQETHGTFFSNFVLGFFLSGTFVFFISIMLNLNPT